MTALAEEQAQAKVNLYLHVTGLRPDGYHTLDSVVVFAEIADRVTAAPAPDLRLVIDGPFAAGLSPGEDNLAVRAARALAHAVGISPHAALGLTKMLPCAAGLGGGSADAGATFRLLRNFWKLGGIELLPLAAGLGADVPASVASLPCRTGGAGEVLDRAPALPAFGLCLVNPRIELPTKAVFAAWNGRFSQLACLPSSWPDAIALAASLARLRNDLEPAAIALCSPVATVLKVLGNEPGCLLARMSGSGATCFGIFADATGAERAAQRINRPDWWCWGGGVRRESSYVSGENGTSSE